MNGDAAEAALSLAQEAMSLAKALQDDANAVWQPPPEVQPSRHEAVVPSVLFQRANRNYLVMVVHQINTTYENACFDACAVMVRRLVESLIIEAFEANGLDALIKGPDTYFLQLGQLIDKTLAQTQWNLNRTSQKTLKKLKSGGDTSAHNRRYIAPRHDIEEIIHDIRVVVQELLAIAKLR
jgi:hypothetical protein